MKTRTLKELILYGYRYWVGYGIVVGFIIYFLGWKLGSLTNGLSTAELTIAAKNSSLSGILSNPAAPLHSLLQWISIRFLGVEALYLRLPTALLGLVVAFFLYQLMRKWFGKPTALLSTAIFISADWFLFIARYGTGGIEFSLWLSLALLCFTKLIERNYKWLVLYALSLVGLLLTPFGVYAALTLTISLFIGKVFRERLHESSLLYKVPAFLLVLVGLGFVSYTTYQNHAFGLSLIGFQNLPSPLEYFKNVAVNTSAVVAVLPDANPTISPNGIFFVRFFELIFIVFGVLMLFKTRVNRLNVAVLILSVALAFASGLSAGSRGSGLMLIPAAIFMTAGIRHFRYRWQRTFPKNPYARLVGTMPLAFLFLTVVALHYVSYFRLWPTRPATAVAFSNDLPLAVRELSSESYRNEICYIDTDDINLQTLLRNTKLACTVTFANDANARVPTVALLKPNTLPPNQLNTAVKPLVDSKTDSNVRWLVVTQSVN